MPFKRERQETAWSQLSDYFVKDTETTQTQSKHVWGSSTTVLKFHLDTFLGHIKGPKGTSKASPWSRSSQNVFNQILFQPRDLHRGPLEEPVHLQIRSRCGYCLNRFWGMISRAASFCSLDVRSIFLNYSKYKDIIAAAALNWELSTSLEWFA